MTIDLEAALRLAEEAERIAIDGDRLPMEWSETREREDGYPYVPQCSYLGGTLISLADTYEESEHDCAYVAFAVNNVPALASTVRGLVERVMGQPAWHKRPPAPGTYVWASWSCQYVVRVENVEKVGVLDGAMYFGPLPSMPTPEKAAAEKMVDHLDKIGGWSNG